MALGTLVISCGPEPFDVQDGGYLGENVNPPRSASFIFGQTSELSFSLDVTDNGNSISNITMFKTLTTPAGTSPVAEVDVTSGTYSQTLAELFADVPVDGNVLTEDDLNPGDYWEMTYEITLSDGTVLESPATTVVGFSCPLEADFTGMYEVQEVTGSYFGVGLFDAGVVELSEVSEFVRSFDAVYLPAFGIGNGPETFSFTLECGNVIFGENQGTGLACSNLIVFGPALTPATFDATDDSEFDVTFTEDVTQDCGGTAQVTVHFVKQ